MRIRIILILSLCFLFISHCIAQKKIFEKAIQNGKESDGRYYINLSDKDCAKYSIIKSEAEQENNVVIDRFETKNVNIFGESVNCACVIGFRLKSEANSCQGIAEELIRLNNSKKSLQLVGEIPCEQFICVKSYLEGKGYQAIKLTTMSGGDYYTKRQEICGTKYNEMMRIEFKTPQLIEQERIVKEQREAEIARVNKAILEGTLNGYFEWNFKRETGVIVRYEGNWKNGKFHGYGKHISKQDIGWCNWGDWGCYRTIYDGEWKDGLYDGYGSLIINYRQYDGYFLKGKKNGLFKVTNTGFGSSCYEADINYDMDNVVSSNVIQDCEQQWKEEGKQRVEIAKTTGNYWDIDEKTSKPLDYICDGVKYKYQPVKITCKCKYTSSETIYYWSGDCGYKKGYYRSETFSDSYLGETKEELYKTLKSLCGCN